MPAFASRASMSDAAHFPADAGLAFPLTDLTLRLIAPPLATLAALAVGASLWPAVAAGAVFAMIALVNHAPLGRLRTATAPPPRVDHRDLVAWARDLSEERAEVRRARPPRGSAQAALV